MELLLILTYTAICYAIFKIFRVPVNKWTIPTAVLGGVILIALILLVMNYNHPLHQAGAALFLHHADRAGGARRGGRGPGAGRTFPLKAGRRPVPDRPAPLRVRRRAEARGAGRGRAERARSSRPRSTPRAPTPTRPGRARSGAAGLRAVRAGQRARRPAVAVFCGARGREPARHLSRSRGGAGERPARRRAGAAGLRGADRRREHHRGAPAGRAARRPSTISPRRRSRPRPTAT